MSDQSGKKEDTPAARDRKPVLFISHRHEQKPIADVIRQFADTWTGGQIEIHQSSSADAEGPRQGQNLTSQLRNALWRASVVVLLYTTQDEDWSYCMWECGVAQLPEPSDTKMVILQSSEQYPAVFAEHLRVGMSSETDIEKFVNDLLTDKAYFSKLGHAVTEHLPHSQIVKKAAAELHASLRPVLPERGVDVNDEWPPFPQLTIVLSDAQVERIKAAEGSDEEKLAVAYQIVFEEADVIGGDGKIGSIFDVNGFPLRRPTTIPMRELVEHWQSSTPTPASRWMDDLARQIRATVAGSNPTARWQLMRGAERDNTAWYGPVVRYFKRMRSEHRAEIDVTFCKFRLDADKRVEIEVVAVEGDG